MRPGGTQPALLSGQPEEQEEEEDTGVKMLIVLTLLATVPTTVPTAPDVADPAEAAPSAHDVDVTLRGSPESMARQHAVATDHGLTFVGSLGDMEVLAGEGHLVPVPGGTNYEVMDWVFPYAVPEVRTFVERLAAEYRQACGETMVVTSLTRPFSEQPPNAHQLSVHPAGMAVDLRIPQTPACREFIEARVLEKEEAGLVDITREVSPPHYHVAVFPQPFSAWAALQPPLHEPEPAAPAAPPGGAGPAPLLVLGIPLLMGAAVAANWWMMRRRGVET
jgi:hypothetical protein